MDWTPYRDEQLKRLWDDGLTATQIGVEMGITKGSVLGRRFRLGLPARFTRTKQESQDWAAAKAAGQDWIPVKRYRRERERARKRSERKPRKPRSKMETYAKADKERAGIKWPAFEVCETSIGILELTNETCRWPQGEDPVRYCGCSVMRNSPYCEYHQALAYRKAE